jgi:hypothetical protein
MRAALKPRHAAEQGAHLNTAFSGGVRQLQMVLPTWLVMVPSVCLLLRLRLLLLLLLALLLLLLLLLALLLLLLGGLQRWRLMLGLPPVQPPVLQPCHDQKLRAPEQHLQPPQSCPRLHHHPQVEQH